MPTGAGSLRRTCPAPGRAGAGLAADGSVRLPAGAGLGPGAWGLGVYSVPVVSAKISSAIW
jgi:hypothetical protein